MQRDRLDLIDEITLVAIAALIALMLLQPTATHEDVASEPAAPSTVKGLVILGGSENNSQ